MGAQHSCHCERDSAEADDKDADSPVQAIVDAPDGLASNASQQQPSSGKAARKPPAQRARSASPGRVGGQHLAGGQRSPVGSGSDAAAARSSSKPRAGQRRPKEGAQDGAEPATASKSEPRPKRSSSATKSRQSKSGSSLGESSPGASAAAGSTEECPGIAMAAKVEKKALTPLQKIRQRQEEEKKRATEMLGVVDDIMAGKYTSGGAAKKQEPKESMRIHMPSKYEREGTRKLLLETFRMEYRRMGEAKKALSQRTDQKLAMFSQQEVAGLTIKDGHRSMPRPANVELPRDFRKHIGTIPLAALRKHSCKSPRKLLSVYGDIFDVSDRPDKYGEEGPYSWMTGNDITWGFVSGRDVPDEINKFYDMWKIAPKSLQERKMTGLLSWVAFYEYEYGGIVGRLNEYENEPGLKGPPMEDCEECCVM